MFRRRALVGLFLCSSAAYVACTSKTSTDDGSKTILVADGQTCGDIQNEPSSIVAECESGDDCEPLLDSFPDGGIGLRIGICGQRSASCATASAPCPSGTDCVDLVEPDRTFAECLARCTIAADCPAPFQLCDFQHCQPLPCATDADCQKEGTCADHLCVRGDAGAQ